MKKFYYLPLALAALAFSACSSDDGVTADEGTELQRVLAEGGYMKVAVSLPTTTATKAPTTDGSATLDHGLASEYTARDGVLMLFAAGTTDTEANATFLSAYTISDLDGSTFSDQISKVISVKETKDKLEGKTQLYAFVILNNNGLVTSETGTGSTKTWKINGTTLSSTTTFSTISQMIIGSSTGTSDATLFGTGAIGTKGILMTNAPLSLSAGGTSKPLGTYSTLATVDVNKIYTTETAAAANPAAEIFVERAVAKVTMHKTSDKPLTDATANGLTATTSAWALDYTNKYSFLVHQLYGTSIPQSSSGTAVTVADWTEYESALTSATDYRFVGNAAVKNGNYYRTYWGVDPNYGGNKTSQFNTITADGVTGKFIEDYTGSDDTEKASNGVQYCMENTFNVANQNQDQTTRAIVKMALKGVKATTATVSSTKETLTATEATDATDIYYVPSQATSLKVSETSSNYYCYTENGFLQLVTNLAIERGITLSGALDNSYIDKKDPTAVKVKNIESDSKITAAQAATINNALGTVTYYAGGVCYYPVRIKHFGDNETSWSSATSGVTSSTIYGIANGSEDATALKNYLGRYGVLRNNWYDITVNSVAKPGTPDIPTPEDTPNDEISNYISFSINILSWAKRTQSADL